MHKFLTVLLFFSLLNTPTSVHAQGRWEPTKPIRIIVPYAAGAAADVMVRIIAEPLRQSLGQPIIVENQAGAGGIIGTGVGAKAAPDGYTWIVGADPAFTINPHLTTVPYDPLKAFTAVGLVARQPLVLLVNPALPAKSVTQLVVLAKSRPGKLSIASSGNGSSGHLIAELFSATAGINLLHVPYKGQPAALTDTVGGQVDMTFSSIGAAHAFITSGKLLAIATSGPRRFEGLPDVPTLNEAGLPGAEMRTWLGLLVPAGTPAPVVARINTEITNALARPELRQRLVQLGYEPVGGDAAQLTQTIESDYKLFGKLVRDRNIKAD